MKIKSVKMNAFQFDGSHNKEFLKSQFETKKISIHPTISVTCANGATSLVSIGSPLQSVTSYSIYHIEPTGNKGFQKTFWNIFKFAEMFRKAKIILVCIASVNNYAA